MPNYTNPQENSKGSNGKYFGGMGFSEAGRKGGKQKGKNKKREQNDADKPVSNENQSDSPSSTNS